MQEIKAIIYILYLKNQRTGVVSCSYYIIPINAIVDIFKRKGNKFEAVKHARKFLSSEDGNREGETGL